MSTEDSGATPHLDPLPLGRGEEKDASDPSTRKNPKDAQKRSFLSPTGGEDQGEGARAHAARHQVTNRGRKLRKKATWAEKIIWRQLRNRKFVGHKFRRQHDVGPYNLDFYCPEARLSIELDGREHGHPERQATDAKRTAYLNSLGIKELRFWNYIVRENIRVVLDTILRELADRTPHLDPLPLRRGEEKTHSENSTSENPKDAHKRSFLAPIGGEDQGEGARPPRKPLLKFIGPNNGVFPKARSK